MNAYPLDKIQICKKTREIASKTCLETFSKAIKENQSVSEKQFAQWWLDALNNQPDIEKGGWYDPPPGGIACLFGTEQDKDRVCYTTLRPEFYWPQENKLAENSLGYVFASPYTMNSDVPIIGDFGFTFYRGNNVTIQAHFRKCWKLLWEITETLRPGMKYKECYKTTIDLLGQNHLINTIKSSTDKRGIDIGHSIPFIEEDEKIPKMTTEEMHTFISKKRVFFNDAEERKISEDCAFTFEPRIISSDDPTLPMCSFHMIVAFIDGKQEITSNFDSLFELLGMQWIKE